jgi:hypothetical protein
VAYTIQWQHSHETISPQASPLQCVPLADSCLALGAAACRGAVETIGRLVADGGLGPKASGGRVVYAQARPRIWAGATGLAWAELTRASAVVCVQRPPVACAFHPPPCFATLSLPPCRGPQCHTARQPFAHPSRQTNRPLPQTDSVFLHLPAASAAEAVGLGQAAARAVTAGLPPPMELKFEKVFCPLLLMHVNRCGGDERALRACARPSGAGLNTAHRAPRHSRARACKPTRTARAPNRLVSRPFQPNRYAGRAYETAAQAERGAGVLAIKGVKAIWRQSAPLIQATLQVRAWGWVQAFGGRAPHHLPPAGRVLEGWERIPATAQSQRHLGRPQIKLMPKTTPNANP